MNEFDKLVKFLELFELNKVVILTQENKRQVNIYVNNKKVWDVIELNKYYLEAFNPVTANIYQADNFKDIIKYLLENASF